MADDELLEDVIIILPQCKFYWFWWVLGWVIYPTIITIISISLLIVSFDSFFEYAFGELNYLIKIILTIISKTFILSYFIKAYFIEELRVKFAK